MAGIFGGLQSLHTDSYDEVLSVPTEKAARIAIATQNILKEEAHLTDVIDPLGGSYYVEALTDQMEAKIREVIARIDAAGGMYAAVEAGLPQQICGDSALAFAAEGRRRRADRRRRQQVPRCRPRRRWRARRSSRRRARRWRRRSSGSSGSRPSAIRAQVRGALDALARAAESKDENVYERVVEAACAGVTHGEICAKLRQVYGFGQPLIVA